MEDPLVAIGFVNLSTVRVDIVFPVSCVESCCVIHLGCCYITIDAALQVMYFL